MIPKIIHYCWLSEDPIPDKLRKYMSDWKKKLPDYEIKKWDFSVFDKSSVLWVRQAYTCKKYAFAADYIRLYALYYYGGIYLDSDVEVIKSFNDYLPLSSMIGWQQERDGLEVAAFGVEKGTPWIKHCLDYYKERPFVKADGKFDMKTLPLIVEEILRYNNIPLVDVCNLPEALSISGNQIPVFPPDYFSPKRKDGQIVTTANTITIHHFAASWTPVWHHFFRKIILIVGGEKLRSLVSSIYRKYICHE